MEITFDQAAETDVPQIVELMREFAEFENLSADCEITAEKLAAAMFGENSFVECLTAKSGEILIGYAIFYPHFSSFRGQRGFYLEDIYIREEFRGLRIGEKMLGQIALNGKARGFERIDFQVLEWNAPAVGFYKKLGAAVNEDERHFKFDGAAFENLFRSAENSGV